MKIKEFIDARGITLNELADTIGFNRGYVKASLRGQLRISKAMAEAFEDFIANRLFDEERDLVVDKIEDKYAVKKPTLPPILARNIPIRVDYRGVPVCDQKDVMLSVLEELKKLITEYVR